MAIEHAHNRTRPDEISWGKWLAHEAGYLQIPNLPDPTSTFNLYLYDRGNLVNLADPSGRIARV